MEESWGLFFFFIGVTVASLGCFVVPVTQPPSILALGTKHASGAAVGTLRRRHFFFFFLGDVNENLY